jgi:hypothetical protein
MSIKRSDTVGEPISTFPSRRFYIEFSALIISSATPDDPLLQARSTGEAGCKAFGVLPTSLRESRFLMAYSHSYQRN